MNFPASLTVGGLDLLSSAVVLVDDHHVIRYANPAAENLFATSARLLLGQSIKKLLGEPVGLSAALTSALVNQWSYTSHNIPITLAAETLHVDCTVTPVMLEGAQLLLEVRPIDQQLKATREEQLAQQQQANRELVRNLAHEIKNPLGGIRGSAQLLEHELQDDQLKEYTQVIIQEVDRLQDLMQRLLSSHRSMQPTLMNIHEILERVRRLIHAEYPDVHVQRDYDTSLPELTGDKEQLIQAVLNIARNAAQAMQSKGEIIFSTRAARQVILAKKHYQLALAVQVIDNGPGIPTHLKDSIFYPLVSGREHGSGLGLTIAQSFIQQHGGTIEVTSRAGYTCFTLMLPLAMPTVHAVSQANKVYSGMQHE
ncbi:MAG: PAS domain-containing protein [Rugosibacter sp.]|nr:PAS domain-containing protein [Rugosibacter sp.]